MAIQIDPDRRLVLSFREVQELTRWPDSMVVDYQGILQDLLDVVEQANGNETDLQDQIDDANTEILRNKQWLASVAITAARSVAINRAALNAMKNLEQLQYAW
jgi:hypothetical protein